jgi:non-ribosomal peptide synthase protein (TIGR01720 family)
VAERAQSEPADEVLEHWNAMPWSGAQPLPRDFAGGANFESSADTVEVALDAAATRELVQGSAHGFAARPDDLMLTALAQVICAWAGGSAAAVVLEGHGREELFDGVDVSRTVGWFTSLYPLALELAGGSPLDDLKRVKEQLRRVPERGRVFGRLRYGGPAAVQAELAALPAPEISFNHLGQLDSAFASDSPLAPAAESSGPARAPEAPRAHLIDVTARVQERVLRISWTYSRSCHGRPTVQRLAELHLERLRALIEVCAGGAESALTPADFPLAPGLDQAALDRLLAKARAE